MECGNQINFPGQKRKTCTSDKKDEQKNLKENRKFDPRITKKILG